MAKDKKDLLRGRNRNILQVKAEEINLEEEKEKEVPLTELPQPEEKTVETPPLPKAESETKVKKRAKKSRKQSELPGGIKRFTAYLLESDIARLKEISAQTHIPVKDLMNEAIKDYLKNRWDEKEMKAFQEANAKFFKYRNL